MDFDSSKGRCSDGCEWEDHAPSHQVKTWLEKLRELTSELSITLENPEGTRRIHFISINTGKSIRTTIIGYDEKNPDEELIFDSQNGLPLHKLIDNECRLIRGKLGELIEFLKKLELS